MAQWQISLPSETSEAKQRQDAGSLRFWRGFGHLSSADLGGRCCAANSSVLAVQEDTNLTFLVLAREGGHIFFNTQEYAQYDLPAESWHL